MRKNINRAATRNVIRETLALRGFSDKRMDGTTLPGEAFGIGARVTGYCDVPALKAQDYLFTLTATPQDVVLELDTYTAQHGLALHADAFDVDAWDAGKLYLHASPPSRASYRLLHRTARLLLQGVDARLSGGIYIKGVVR